MSTDSPPKTHVYPVNIYYTTSDYVPPTIPQPGMPKTTIIKPIINWPSYSPKYPENTFKVGDKAKLPNGQVKKVNQVKNQTAQVNGYSFWFDFDILEKI
jgi:hypothetical protein